MEKKEILQAWQENLLAWLTFASWGPPVAT